MAALPFASRRAIEILVLEVSGPAHREDALAELLYRLKADREVVPLYVGETLVEHPEVWTNNPLGKRLALGTLCEIVGYFSAEDQERLVRMYQRRLNQAHLRILQIEQDLTTSLSLPREILSEFDREFSPLRLFAESVLELAGADHSDGILASILEQLIALSVGREERIALLLQRLQSRASASSWQRLCKLASRSVELALNNPPLDERALIHADASTARFGKQSLLDECFVATAERFPDVLKRNLLRTASTSVDVH